jgi:hypothetical protein
METLQNPQQLPLPQNDSDIFLNQDQFTIIDQRKQIHYFLFKHGIYILMVILGGIGLYLLTLVSQPIKSLAERDSSSGEHLAAQQDRNEAIPEIPGLDMEILYGSLTHQT